MPQIYKCYIVRRPTEAFFSLSEDQQRSLLEKVQQALKDAGGESVVMCDIRWATDGGFVFGVEVFPNLEAVQEHNRLLNQLNWTRYIEAESYLGTAAQPM
jgi:hypothetical protein